MHIRFVLTLPVADAGLELATVRLATALTEVGHQCDLIVPGQSVGPDQPFPVREVEALPRRGHRLVDHAGLLREVSAGDPDLIVVSDEDPDLLELLIRVAPTAVSSHQHWPVCPDGGRYWYRFEHECTVKAGAKCLLLRPVLGCSGKARVLSPAPVSRHRRLLRLLKAGRFGALAISSRQAALMLAHGIPEDHLAVMPNLGLRMSPSELADAAADAPAQWRSAVVFLGRLSKEKGAQLLPEIADQMPQAALQIFGDGYLQASLQQRFGGPLAGRITQRQVAGVLQWARAVVFPSLWPEPGGIVGIDSQLFGAPLAAFALGAALDWPQATLFERDDVARIGNWAQHQPAAKIARAPEAIALAQAEYWRRVASRADRALRSYVTNGRFVSVGSDAVREDLSAAIALGQSASAPSPNVLGPET